MKRKKIDSFTLFVILLLALILTLLGMLLAGMKEEKRQFTVLLPLGDLAYDEDFLQKAKKIKGIKEIWPVIEVPVSYTHLDVYKRQVLECLQDAHRPRILLW